MTVLSEEGFVLRRPFARLGPVGGACTAAGRASSPIHGDAASEAGITGFRVAVVAPRPYLLATFPAIERIRRPIDFGIFHDELSARGSALQRPCWS
jgi:hypothetical protein